MNGTDPQSATSSGFGAPINGVGPSDPPAVSGDTRTPGDVAPTRGDLLGHIDDLEAREATNRETIGHLEDQGDTDRKLIGHLEAQALLDSALIEQLEASGEIERFEVKGLRVALSTCRRIGAAIGFVMATRQVSQDEALRTLSQASQDTNRKLRDVADYVTLTGDVPTSTPPG
jgi:ANTAR domain